MSSAVRHACGPQTVHFGKLPSRGDFVRSTRGSGLIQRLDTWMSQAVELMSEEPRWKLVYDSAGPVHFAILGPGHAVGLAGHLVTSRDASGRRFPFVRAATFDIRQPDHVLSYGPMALVPFWGHHAGQVAQAVQAETFTESLLTPFQGPACWEGHRLRDDYRSAAVGCSLGQLSQGVQQVEPEWDTRQALLALGMLLQPVSTRGCADLGRGLALPLPLDEGLQPLAMSFWTSLIAPFFQSTPAELSLVVCRQAERPLLLIGFRSVSPVSLRAALDPAFAVQQHQSLAQSGWVEDCVGGDHGLRKLSTVLRDPALSWPAAAQVFHEVFLGV